MNKKTSWIALLIIIIILAIVFWPKSHATEDKVVRVGYFPLLSTTPLYIAEEKGLFVEKGIKIEKTLFQTSNQLTDALIRGDVDFGTYISLVPVVAAEMGDPGKIQIFAHSDLVMDPPYDNLVVPKDSSIQNPTQLAGKRIGVFPGTTQKSIVKKYLMNKGVDVSTVTFVEIPPQNQLVALSQGSVDALQAIEPNRTISIETGMARAINISTYAETYEHMPFIVGAVSSSFVKEHPELTKEVIEVFSAGNDYMTTNEAETRQIAAKNLNMEQDIAAKVKIHPYVPVNPKSIEDFMDFLVSIGEIKTKPDLSQMFYK